MNACNFLRFGDSTFSIFACNFFQKVLAKNIERMDAIRNTPVYVQKKYETLSRKLFLLWEFLATEGLCQEAREYLEDHKDEEVPMDFSFILE